MSQQVPPFPTHVPMSWSQVWIRVLTQPSPVTFQAVLTDPTASNRRAYTWTAVATLIEIVLALLIQLPLLSRFPASFPTARGVSSGFNPSSILGLYICLVPLAPFLAVLGLIIDVAITQFIAKMFGGVGTYGELTYVFAAFEAPYGLVSSVIGLTPVGFCLALPLAIYALVLRVMAVKAVNQFTYGKAILAVFFIPICLFALAILVITFSAMSNSLHR